MNDLEHICDLLNHLGATTPRGFFHCLTLTADGHVRVTFTNLTENFNVRELSLVTTPTPHETQTSHRPR